MIKLTKGLDNKRIYIFLSFVILIGILVYYRVTGNSFQSKWDDQWVVINSYTENGFNFDNIRDIFLYPYHSQYSPINQLLYTSIFHFYGYNPSAFHIVSLCLHLSNVLLVFWFIKKLIITYDWDVPFGATFVALTASLLFCINPINVEAVAWMSASKVLIYTGFYLLALISYLHWYTQGKVIFLVISFLFFVFSFLSKEQAITFPAVIILFEYLRHKNSVKQYNYVFIVLLFSCTVLFAYITLQSQALSNQGVWSSEQSYTVGYRFLFGSYAMIEYVTKIILPINLVYVYPFPMRIGSDIPARFYIYPILIIIIFSGLFESIKRYDSRIFILGFFIIGISMVLHIVPISRFVIVADRYAYLSTIPICFSIGQLIYFICKLKKYNIALIVICLFYFSYLSIYTSKRVPVWKNSETLKQEVKEIQSRQLKNRPISK